MDYPKSVPGIGLVNGKFVDENTTTGTPGSLIPSTWGNSLTDELLNVIQAGGLEPSEVERDQLLEAIRALIETRVNDASALPIGSMVPFPKGAVPPGFLEVDGSVHSISIYPDLAAYLGAAFNTGSEPSGHFRLPESRGEFLRGWDHGRGVDALRSVGSLQKGSLVAYDADFDGFTAVVGMGGAPGSQAESIGVDSLSASGFFNSYPVKIGFSNLYNSPITKGDVFLGLTRPRNLAVMWCIKAWSAPVSQGLIDIAALAQDVEKQKTLAIVGSHKNLVLSASGLNALVNVSADQLIVGTDGLVRSLSGVNLSFSGLAAGANGLDVGALAASTWYSVWVIWSGSMVAGLLSLSATAPILPAGYTLKARVGWIRTDATANKFPLGFNQCGRRARWKVSAGSNLVAMPPMASGTAGSMAVPTYVAVSVSAFVPPTASAIVVMLAAYNSGGCVVAPSLGYGSYTSISNPPRAQAYVASAGNPATSVDAEMALESSNIYYASNAAAGGLFCAGYEDNL